jgi:hypothetical protein
MTNDTNSQSNQRWMPTAAGVLCIVSGSLGLFSRLIWLAFGNALASQIQHSIYPSSTYNPLGGFFIFFGVVYLLSAVFDILAIIGGIFALQRKNWGLSLAGAISTLLAGSWLFGALSIVFISLSRKEFD